MEATEEISSEANMKNEYYPGTMQKKPIIFLKWWPVLIGNDLKLTGMSVGQDKVSRTIQSRISRRIFYDTNKTICALGGPAIIQSTLPQFIQQAFDNGIPENWTEIRLLWINHIHFGLRVKLVCVNNNLETDLRPSDTETVILETDTELDVNHSEIVRQKQSVAGKDMNEKPAGVDLTSYSAAIVTPQPKPNLNPCTAEQNNVKDSHGNIVTKNTLNCIKDKQQSFSSKPVNIPVLIRKYNRISELLKVSLMRENLKQNRSVRNNAVPKIIIRKCKRKAPRVPPKNNLLVTGVITISDDENTNQNVIRADGNRNEQKGDDNVSQLQDCASTNADRETNDSIIEVQSNEVKEDAIKTKPGLSNQALDKFSQYPGTSSVSFLLVDFGTRIKIIYKLGCITR